MYVNNRIDGIHSYRTIRLPLSTRAKLYNIKLSKSNNRIIIVFKPRIPSILNNDPITLPPISLRSETTFISSISDKCEKYINLKSKCKEVF